MAPGEKTRLWLGFKGGGIKPNFNLNDKIKSIFSKHPLHDYEMDNQNKAIKKEKLQLKYNNIYNLYTLLSN